MGCYADNMTDRDISGVHIKFEASVLHEVCTKNSLYLKSINFRVFYYQWYI